MSAEIPQSLEQPNSQPHPEVGTVALSGVGVEVDHSFDNIWSTDEVDEQAAIQAAAIRPTSHVNSNNSYIAPPTDDQIANAKKYGFDLEKQQKYYSPAEWDNRNNVK